MARQKKSLGPGTMPVKEAGRRGGLTTLKRHGKAHFRKIGRLGGLARHGKRAPARTRTRRARAA